MAPDDAAGFVERTPDRESCWRAVILFGLNVASYKFALGRSLLDLAAQGWESVSLKELAVPFSTYLAEHLRQVDTQGTMPRSRFLDACRAFNRGELSRDRLVETTARLGFVNVIDAFHVVNGREVPHRFFTDERRSTRGIRLTDDLHLLRDGGQYPSLPHEVEARWRLVETSWHLDIPRRALEVTYEPDGGLLVVETDPARRVSLTGCRAALNGYQKGRCFYCRTPITVPEGAVGSPAHVDHFFPHLLISQGFGGRNLDGVWNLTLACLPCNAAKSARVPALPLVERLHRRNEYLIGSYHPLRDTLIAQTGPTTAARRHYLQSAYNDAVDRLIHTWTPPAEGPPL
jgi:5-methylcytosine-specific restriction endonuclease McrA